LRVYKDAFNAAMEIFNITKKFPVEEKYALIDQIRRSSRSVCSNLGEGWRKRRYAAAFVAKLSDSETEACETQIWLEFSLACNYIEGKTYLRLYENYEIILGQLIKMINQPEKWIIKKP